uniref:Uncharacterized protein n=2 Tax=Arundo donax TaxID=35708 RepID=A0A0A8Y003_ARUDO
MLASGSGLHIIRSSSPKLKASCRDMFRSYCRAIEISNVVMLCEFLCLLRLILCEVHDCIKTNAESTGTRRGNMLFF